MKKRIESFDEFKAHCSTVIEIPVAWGEMDSFQHVNNIFYFRYFESVRMHYLGLVGALDYLKDHNVGPILGSTNCKFILPLKYPDKITVGTKIDLQTLALDKFDMEYVIFAHNLKKVCAVGNSLVVYYNYNKLTRTPIPEGIRQAIIEREKNS